ncbi:MAG: cbb3-type cytochrome c oxidase subunit I [Pseudomonadota bacterium]
MDHDTYNQMFTLHGAIMVFLGDHSRHPRGARQHHHAAAVGRQDVAFPRMNLASYHLWIVGALFMLSSLAINAVDTGWTFYTPYSTTTSTAVVPAAFGAFILASARSSRA